MKSWTLVSLVVIASFIGCGSSGPDPKEVAASRIMIYPPEGDPISANGGAIDKTEYAEGKTVAITGGRLLVNDKDYGPVQGGDKVKIAANGSVTVNDQPRQPGARQ